MPESIIAAATNNQAPAQKDAPAAAPAAKSEAKQQIVNAPAGKAENQTGDQKEKVQARTEQPVPKKEDNRQQSSWSAFLSSPMVPIILIFVVMIFFMNRSQKKQMQKRQEMMDSITKGTKVLLSSGIYGTVDSVQDEAMIVEIAAGVKIKVAKAGVADVVRSDGKVEGK